MKRTVINLIIGIIIFYIGAEVGYQIAYENVKCMKVTPSKSVII